MSPEYNFYVKANFPGPKEAGELIATIFDVPGVEVVQLQEGVPYILVPNPNFDEYSRGQIIREARNNSKLRQIDLADMAGITNSTLAGIEHGRRSSVETLTRIADALGFAEDDPRREKILVGANLHRHGRRSHIKPEE